MHISFAYYDNPILRQKGKSISKITPDIQQLIDKMKEEMIAHKGIGLAAQQVGHALQLFITAVPIKQADGELIPGPFRVYINAEILEQSEEKEIASEGCLSIPGIKGDVLRSKRIKVRATDLHGNIFEEELTDLDARCVLHEYDHTQGILYIDRVRGKAREDLTPKLNEIKKAFQTNPFLPQR